RPPARPPPFPLPGAAPWAEAALTLPSSLPPQMQVAQQAQLRQETQLLQQTFLTEKDVLLQKEKFIEEEKMKLEKLFKDEVNKAQNLKAEQERQQKEMEQEKQQLKAMLDEAQKHQKEAEENVRHKQEELQQLERQRQQQEKLLEEENKKLRERLEQMQEEYKAALAQTREIMIQTDDLPEEAAVTAAQLPESKAVPNGRDAVDGLAQNGEPEFAFEGIRQKVSAEKLADAGILSKESFEKLAKGVVSVGELSQREDIKKYLQGKSSIAGLLIKPSNQKMSIYEAMKKQLLSPGTALVLLEAQAASGFIIDPVCNARLSVNEAVREGVIGPELHNKMLSAERAVTGYKDPYTGDKISLFQAMTKELIVREHGIRLLEAQIATGGIIDPVHSHRLPVEAAYQRGYFDQEMNQILSDPSDDTKGFFDPNTQENLTYMQLMERCVTDPDTGLCLLPLTDQAAKARELVYTDKEAKDVFKKATVTAPFGKFQGKTVTIWEMINSEYFTEDQRRDLIQQYRTGKITVEKIIKIIITVVEESENKSQMCFEGLRAPVPAAELLESKIINKDLYNQLHQGKRSVKEVAEMESVRQYLRGTDAIAGVLVESTGQKLTFYDALKRNLLKPEIALSLLEAQAATGYILDPVRNKLLSVDEAVKAEVVGPEFHEKLLSAEKAVTGYKDPYTGQTVSLFQALKKGLIPSDTGVRLLDVQLATGGIIDPVNSHRLPLEVAYKRGYLDPEIKEALAELRDDAKAFYCPNTQEHLSYAQLQKSCHRDKQTGFCLLPLSDRAIQAQQEEVYTDSQAKECFDKATVEVPVGSLRGQTMTIWELIHSEYFTEEHRRELLRQYKTGKVTIEKIIKIVITIIEEAETKKQEKLTFSGLRAPVPASELVESRVISKAQYEQLKEGKKSVKDLSETDAVRRFLHGGDCISGVYVEATKEKLNIYEAMKRNLLRPSTAMVLLEAQAATGFLIDAVKNRKLYVNEAVKAGVVGPELHEKLLSAEKAVTGYKDPYSGNTISLFQAMKKGLIVKEHGIRLLEAQIATGGIIDPVHSHRLPVEVAYQRGYFDQEMNQVLSDPSDDTKGFFDPNTHENLTYMQLKEKCIEDPETGLYLLPLREPEKPTVVETTQVDIPVGSRAGSSMSLWEIMHSDLLPEEQRKQLMEEFQSGRVSKERMIIIIIEIIEKTEIIRQQNLMSYDYVRRRITAEDLYEAKIISLDIYNLLKQGSKTFRELLDVETVWKYLYGSGCVAGIYIPSSKQKLSIYQALKKGLITSEVARSLLEAQAATGFMIDPAKNEMLTVDEAVRKGVVGPEIHDRLLSAERAVTGYRDPYSEQKISIFQAMKKDLIPSEEALKLLDAQIATGGVIDPHLGFHLPLEVATQRGFINKDTYDMLSEPSEVRSYVDPSTEEKLSYTQLLKRCRKDEKSGLLLLPLCDTRKLTFRGLRKQITVEELVRSQVMDEATAQRLQEGLTSIEEVSKNLKKFLEGTSCIAGVFVDSTKERLSVYQAMKKGIIRPGTAFELLEAQAATGYVIDPIKGLKLTVEEAVRMGIVGPEFKDKLLSAERAVTGYRDPYSGKLISLFQAMKKGLILKDHGIRLLEAQIATGGIIDPEESHRLPVEIAYKRGLFDEEMNEILLDPSDDTKGFFDPNTEENLTYLQLMERCITDPETGLCLLPLKEKKRERKTSSKSSVRKRRVVIVDPETGKEMSVYEAYRKGLIDHQTYLELSEQECEWEEITTSSSDGVVKSMIIDRRSGRQYDIDDAISKGLIDQSALDHPAPTRTQISMWSDPTEETGPVAGQRLLEAQACTGGIIDPNTGDKCSVADAVNKGLVDKIMVDRINLAQKAFYGFEDPRTKTKMSAAQALKKGCPPSEAAGSIAGVYVEASRKIMSFYDATREHLLSLDSALCLLEAQAAMGFITDPVKNRQVSVAEAVQLGLVGLELKERLLAAEKAATGFVDPYTEEKIPLYQAIQKDLIGKEQGTRLLEAQMATGGIINPGTGCRLPADVACERGYLDEEMSQLVSDPSKGDSKGFLNPSTMERVTYRELIKRCVVDPASGLLLLPLQITFQGLGGRVSSRDLLESGIISPDTFRSLEEGRVSAQEVAENDSVQQFLHGTRSVAGVVLPSGERKSLYQALREHLLVPGAALMLLQVQASTGSLTDPVKNKSYSVDEAVRVGLIGPELHEKLSSAERTITGYKDPATGEMLSLFQAVRKGFIPQDHGVCLLEAQMATGGIIAPGRHLRVPTETACKWGYLDEATRQLLSSLTDAMKGFFDPSSKEKVTYADLLKLCVTDPNTGLLLLPLGGDSREGPEGTHLFFDCRTQTALENTEVPIALGKLKGKSVSLWKLLFSDYIQSERRAALARQYLAGTLSTQELGKAVSATAEEMASTANVTFEGLRDRVTADQLLSSEIINKDLFKKLKEGETSAKEVVSMDTVKKYLQGTGSIGGLLLPDSQEKISIYQAKRKGLLRPGTSLILLEAQAATGFIIDPAANKRYSVDEALRANVIGPDVYDKLLAAEKSVTGYRDPYSGNKISLFQAMNKEFIVREHAIRLLEAQIATGGIIDPVNSHRIPVEVAYKRGYFDKKMNLILSDPSDDTKGFFDPNTHENLTYLQLKEKCITEPSTGLCLLPLNSRKRQFIDDATRRVFRSSWLPVRFGRLRGEKVSVWDLLNSEYFSEGRGDFVERFRSEEMSLQQLVALVLRLVGEMEMKARTQITLEGLRGSVPAVWLLDAGIITEKTFEELAQGRRTPEEVAAMESVKRYLQGTGSIAGVFIEDRCIHEAESGLWLLPLSENAMFCVDEQTMEVLKSVTVCVNIGRFKGQTVSVWDLLNSEYLSDRKRRELVQKYKDENTEVLQEIITIVTTIIKETETQGKKFAFKGLRKRVSASDLFQSQLIDKKTLDELNQGKKTVQEVTEMDSVRRYLEGSNFIAGVLIQPSNKKMSIYQAMRKGILRPGTALVLLEAQAATGYIIDPEKNKKFSVEEALTAGLIGGEVFEKLLCAERAVTGYTDPYTKAPMSLFEAMNQGLIVKSHGIRLLEAQIATGGIIDPVHSHRLPVEVAYQRGYFDQEMNQILSDPSDDTKGFFDPNTHENLTYMQLLERCVQDSETGLYMLQVVQEGGKYFYIDEFTKQVLRSKPLKVEVGKFKDQTVSIWEILCSHYISEQKRKELVMQYKCKSLTLEDLIALIFKIIEDTEQRAEALKVKGFREDVSVSELFDSEIIDKKTLDQLQDGSLTLASLTKRDTVQRYLEGTGCIAGVLLPSRKEKMSIYQALRKGLLTEQCALGLLEAQAATGFLIDPLKNKQLSVDEAVLSGLVGSNLHKTLLSAEKAVTGYTDPHTGSKISLFQAIRQKIAVKEHGTRLLEAQLATGGIIDPVHSHRLPVEVAYRRGYLDEDMFLLLSDPDHGSKGFIDPNTREKISYSQLLQRCSKDRDTGLYLLQVMEKDNDYFYIDEQTKNALLSTKVQVPVGKYKGHVLSLWELLCSEYITEEKRKELVKKYKEESHHIIQGIIDTILNIIKEKEEDRSDVWFQGIRQQITASELLSAQIITEETMEKLHEGTEKAEEIAQMDTVRRYLEGTGSIAGVLVPSKADPAKMEKMSIYQAMWKGILRQGTALVLLEAQAATGFVVDPLANKKLSVDEAVSSGLVGSELHEKLLSAERAVTGYTDPYTGQQISLFQAMKKELIVKEHGIRLLEAQIATGGIIDPVHSHRLPVEVAYQRGYFDQEMNQVLSDPSDDTKGFFDPNTHENLTYMQLLRRCVPDPDTGLLMLQLMDKGSVLYQLTEDARKALQAARTTLSVGLFQGQSVTVWELLFSRYIPEHQREELLRKYKMGTVTISEMITLLTTIVTRAEGQGHGAALAHKPPQREAKPLAENGEAAGSRQKQERDWERERERELEQSLKTHTIEVSAGGFHGRKVSLWELLFSTYVSEAKRQELLGRVRAGSLALDELAGLLTTLIGEAVERSSKVKFTGLRRQVTASDLVDSGIIDKDTLADLVQGSKTVAEVTEMASVKRYLDGTGCIAGVLVPSKADPAKMEKMSIYQAMWKGILRQGTALVLLEAQAATGFVVDPLANKKLSVDEAVSSGLVGSELHEKLLSAERAVTGYTDPYTGQQISLFQAMKKELIVKEHGIRLLEAQIATGGIIDPVHSHRLPVEVAYQRGYFDQEMNQVLSDPSDDTKGFFDPNTHENLTYMQLLRRCVPDPDTGLLMLQLMDKGSVLYQLTEDARKALQAARTTLSVGLFQGQSVTVWELLFSRYIPEHQREELLRKYKMGTVTISEMITLLTTIVTRAEGQGHGAALAHKPPQREAKPLAENGEAAGSRQKQERDWERERERELEQSLKTHTIEVSAGGFHGRKVSLWELLFSTYVSEAKRQELLGRVRAGSLALDELAGLLTTLIGEAVERSSKVKFTGLRRQVTASDLVDSGIIDKDTLADLVQGSKTVAEVTEMASVKRYLDGTGCIAGVLVPSKADPAKMEKMSIYQAMWKGILRQGTALVLLEAQAATGFVVDPLANKKLSVDEAVSSGLVGSELHEKLLSAERAVTGYTDPYTGQQISLFQAMKKELIVKEHGIRLLEAQIATGGIIDPVHSHRLPVEVAYQRGYFDQEMNQVLSDPSDDTKGFFDPNTHENLTYMQLLRRCVPDPDTGLLMLQLMDKGSVLYQLTEDARKALQAARTTLSVGLFQGQSVTVWELLFSRYIPEHQREELLRKYKMGTVTISEMITLLTTIVTRAEGQGHGAALAHKPPQREAKPLAENGEAAGSRQKQERDWERERERELEQSLKTHTIEVSAGGFHGRKVSLWELLFSTYVSEAKRQELLGRVRAGSLALDELAGLLTTLIGEAVERSSKVKFTGLRRQVTASDLVDSGIIDKDTLADLVQGSKTVAEVTEMASVKRYLDGTGCIAGVLVPSKADPAKMEKMSIYQAMWKGILRQGTALVLLEAQAATGFVVDPLANKKLSVDEAVSSGLVGSELHEKLLSAERAVTGYTDPYTGQQISLFQAMKKELIVKEHGIRLLEAQIATGGIIDPVHSHRLPVEVAYQRGYFDQEMNQVLSDPSDDTKGFFDPNTHENLTYMQLLRRCVPDPDTGLLMLQLMDKGSVLYQLTEDARKALQAARTTLSVGLFQGQSVTVWELLFSRYIPEHQREELLRKYKMGTVTISEMITLLTTIVTRAEGQGHGAALAHKPPQREAKPLAENGEAAGSRQKQERDWERERERELEQSLKTHTIEVSAGGFHGRKVSLWELLFSTYVSEAKRQELLGRVRAGSLALDELAGLLTTLIGEAVERSSKVKFTGLRRQVTASDLVDSGIIDKDTLADLVQGSKTVAEVTEMASVKRYLDGTGCIAGVLVPSKADPAKMEKMSIYQAMWKGILRQGTALVLLEAQAATGFVVDPLANKKLSVDEAVSSGLVGSELHEKLLSAERAVTGYTDPYTGQQISLFQAMKKELIVKEHGIRLLEAQIATGGIIDPVHSHRLPVEVAYQRGYFDQEMNQVLSDPSDDTKGFFDPNTHENLTYMQLLRRCMPDPESGLYFFNIFRKSL
uniref:Epiplakin 1 n=1 Tax=Strix occidentalis caurina TaxID=311401 RepID=A0A8D0EWZ2_STROC